MKQEILKRWTCDEAAELYGIRRWGAGYFDIAENGHVVAKPFGNGSSITIDIVDIIKDLQKRDFNLPLVLRFADIINSQMKLLYESFETAIKSAGYRGKYQGVYPVKVNQKQQLVNDILEFGDCYGHGLEAGSKAELITAVTTMKKRDALIICNGYKDEEFLSLALMSTKMGMNTCIVVEMPSEVPIIISLAKSLDIKPFLGVRVKLSSSAGGHWDSSAGDRGKFGMDASQILEMLDILRGANMLDSLRLLHYHLGSQVADIKKIRRALQEACRFYVGLVKEGVPLETINIGGGLAVDYDGSHTNFASSRNYTIKEYAEDVVEVIMNVCDSEGVEHPDIISESGRATVAHHSILLFNILHVKKFEPRTMPLSLPQNAHEMTKNLMSSLQALTSRNAQEIYHDAVYYRDEIRSIFTRGGISLRERGIAENIFWQIICRIADTFESNKYVPDEMENLETAIADVYYGNFSLFQSIPDSWAIDQLFPVMPIHRLNEMPTRQAIITDITCDSDGRIDTFIDLRDVKHSIPLHELKDDEEYYIGVFLVGAYQETLGDMHNLFGTTNVLHVRVNPDGQLSYVKEVPGETVEEVLSYLEYNSDTLMKNLKARAEEATRLGRITAIEKERILEIFSAGMNGYTYFEK